jgi:site-specific recombinase XerD
MPEATHADSLSMEMMAEFFKRLNTRHRIVGRDTERVGVKASTVRTYHRKLRAFFNWLHERGLIEQNPLPKKLPHVDYNDQPALDKKDIEKMLAAVALHSRNALILKRDMAMLHILLFCGLRKSEFISLQVMDIDMDRRILQVRAETSKSRRGRLIPLNSTLLLHLQDYIAERNRRRYRTASFFVSTTNDVGLSAHGLKHWVKRLIETSGVKFHLHRFRHTFARNLGFQNTNVGKIQQLLGHADLRMTQKYMRSMTVEDSRDDINMLEIATFV